MKKIIGLCVLFSAPLFATPTPDDLKCKGSLYGSDETEVIEAHALVHFNSPTNYTVSVYDHDKETPTHQFSSVVDMKEDPEEKAIPGTNIQTAINSSIKFEGLAFDSLIALMEDNRGLAIKGYSLYSEDHEYSLFDLYGTFRCQPAKL